jgi:hypothetical protein
MMRWIENLFMRNVPSPERLAELGLGELRLELFQAEQRVLDAQMQAAFYRTRLSFLQDVVEMGIERVADRRHGQPETPQVSRNSANVSEIMPESRKAR